MTMSDQTTKQDAEGQFAKSRADRHNDGLASATPRTVTGKDDATLENTDDKPSPDPGFDIGNQTTRRN
ncbi:MAG: hypothetical protein KL863_22995 [Rhizobium sp.]|nr:hypothetical protein [Rhizobium sp.]